MTTIDKKEAMFTIHEIEGALVCLICTQNLPTVLGMTKRVVKAQYGYYLSPGAELTISIHFDKAEAALPQAGTQLLVVCDDRRHCKLDSAEAIVSLGEDIGDRI